jgi:hypothetical protein
VVYKRNRKMKRIQTYQKGDPEYLIIQKQYHELREEERAELSEWVQSKEDYDRIRKVLLELHDDQEEWLEPEAVIKKNLMRKFESEEKGGRLIWLNSIFFTPGEKLSKQPIVRYGIAAACVIGLAVFFIRPETNNAPVAENSSTEQSIEHSDWADAGTDSVADSDTLRVFAEVKSEMPMVPPAPISKEYKFQESEEILLRDEIVSRSVADACEGPPPAAFKSEESRPALVEEASKDAEMNTTTMSEPTIKRNESVAARKSSTDVVVHSQNIDLSVSMVDAKKLLDELFTAR